MKYKVMKSIRHDGVLYLAGPDQGEARADVLKVDLTGEIELTPEQAALMTTGQLAPLATEKPKGKKEASA